MEIASYLPKWSNESGLRPVRPGIASLSKRWQVAVEPLVFRDVRVKSTELDKFTSAFSAYPDRRRYLRNLNLHIMLPRTGGCPRPGSGRLEELVKMKFRIA